MDSEIRDWFREAVQRPAERRAEWLRESCPDDRVRAEVLSLLDHDTDPDQDTSPALHEPVRAAAAKLGLFGRIAPGLRVGAFELGKLLGRGGMGCVFEAHRVDGQIRQTVAIKFFDVPASDDHFREAATARFLQERRILATLQHPYIAALIDVGSLADVPYFVMERVEGEPIDTFVENQALGTAARIELVLKIVDAVEKAHQNLIVHRDIKPSNVLVMPDGTPKLLDFGIAKELFGPSGTQTFAAALTPEYAGPEQVLGGPVTIATDVYGVGALLYRLLTGQPPRPLRGGSPWDWLRAATEEEVTAPSAYKPGLPGDLENILRKALHRDADRRYESAHAFADDLRRFLERRAVSATPDSLGYRLKTVLRRNKLLTAATSLAVVSLIAGTAVSTHQALLAKRRFSEVRQLANVFLFDFERSIRDTPGTLDARHLVASTAQKYLKQLAAESRHDASLQREIAEAYERLADVQGALQPAGGRSPEEIESLSRALEIRRSLGDDASRAPALHRKYIEAAAFLGARIQDRKNAGEAAKVSGEAMRLSESWVAAEPGNVDALIAANVAFMRGATMLETAGQIDRALLTLEKSVGFGRRAHAAAPGDQTTSLRVAHAERTYSELLQTAKRYSDALGHGKRALDLIEPLWKKQPYDPAVRSAFLSANSAVGIAHRSLGLRDPRHLEEALPYLRRAYELAHETMLADPRNTRNRGLFVAHTHRLCSLLNGLHRFDEAIVLFGKADEAARELTRIDPLNRRSWYLLGKNQGDLAWLLLSTGRAAEARRAFLAADEGYARALEMDPLDTVVLECRTGQREGLARVALKMRKPSEARRWMTECLELIRSMVRRNASLKTYIYAYDRKLKLARDLGLSTAGLE